MSRVSKNPVPIPSNVEVTITAAKITVRGPNGVLEQKLDPQLLLKQENNTLVVGQVTNSKELNAMSGTTRSLVANMVKGVSSGFEKKLQLVGVGYRAQVNGKNINLNLGYSHPINYQIPEDIQVVIPAPTEIVIKGIDKQKVGQIAAEIRAFRQPEPYKGKGIRYEDETVILKEAKKK
ncbi:large subunit ribosomal protein L6 [Nitrosomonas sp. Nm51]|uniref:50S ribosomal protein L6 n=1 Tax=Nitrosomonas sp. Nm51 TaxID=133720 RepID=UPI0008B3C9DB|nr:50S ribosomal protein L6 [Nitrosomonas sp. Nm51]SER60533.1 large subunit ribosomal protein L6 [Nitrosomonas sp. Nm51]